MLTVCFGFVLLPYLFRQVKFQAAKSDGPKRVAEEVILEVEDLAATATAAKQQKMDGEATTSTKPIANQAAVGTFKRPQVNRNGFSQKSSLANLVKPKARFTATATTTTTSPATSTVAPVTETSIKSDRPNASDTGSSTSTVSKPANTTNALSLLSGYDNNTDSDDSD